MTKKQSIAYGGTGRRSYGVRKFRKVDSTIDNLDGVIIDPDAPVGSALVKTEDGAFRAQPAAGVGDMTRAAYDPSHLGRVRAASTLTDGTNTVTAEEAAVIRDAAHTHENQEFLDNLCHSTVGDVHGPAKHGNGTVPLWDGINSRSLKDGLTVVTTVGRVGNDLNLPTEQAVREAIDAPKVCLSMLEHVSAVVAPLAGQTWIERKDDVTKTLKYFDGANTYSAELHQD